MKLFNKYIMNNNLFNINHFICYSVSRLFAFAWFLSEDGGITSNYFSSLFYSTKLFPCLSLEIIGTTFLIHIQHVTLNKNNAPATIKTIIQISLFATLYSLNICKGTSCVGYTNL